MSFRHLGIAVEFFSQRAFNNLCWPRAQPHTRALFTDATLLFQQRDHWFRSVLVELGAISVFDSTDVSSEFDCRYLHTKTKTEIRDLVLARITRSVEFSFNTTNTKSAGNQDAGYIFELAIHAVLQRFGIDKFQVDSAVFTGGGVSERFVDTLIGVTDIHVFADHCNLDTLIRTDDAFDELPPVCEIGFRSFKMQQVAHQLIQSFRVQSQGHFINCVFDVGLLDNRFLRNAAKHRQFATQVAVERFFSAAN